MDGSRPAVDRNRAIVEEKSKWFAALANLLLPGLGYFYLGRDTDAFNVGNRGLVTVVAFLFGLVTVIFGIGVVLIIVLEVVVVYDCFTTAEDTKLETKLRAARREERHGA